MDESLKITLTDFDDWKGYFKGSLMRLCLAYDDGIRLKSVFFIKKLVTKIFSNYYVTLFILSF